MSPALIVLFVIMVPEAIDLVAQMLQRSWIGKPVPDELNDIYEENEYATSNAYTREKQTFGLVKNAFDTLLFIGFWFLGGFGKLQAYCNGLGLSAAVAGLVFFGLLMVASQALGIPWSIYSTFVIEEKYGFNNTNCRTFVKDRVKGLVLMILIGAPLLWVVLYFFERCGSLAWLYVWITISVFQLVLFFLAPVLILPLFLEMIPLPAGTAATVTGLDKAGKYKFLNRIYYQKMDKETNEAVKYNGKECWTTKDNQFAGGAHGKKLCLFATAGGWAITEGEEPQDSPVYASVTSSASFPDAASEWKLNKLDGDEGNVAAPLLGNNTPQKMVVTMCEVGKLKDQLLALAEKLKYNCKNLFVIDGSTRSSHSNAFCTGFGQFRRICLFDTLLSQMTNDEITAILGHEIGHDKLYHTIFRLVLGVGLSFIQFFMLGKFIQDPFLAKAFFLDEPSIYTGMLLFSVVWGVFEFFLSIPLTVKSRMDEYAADRFAVEAGKTYAPHLAAGLKKLTKNSKSNLTPHPFYTFLHYSHPAMVVRLQAIAAHHKATWGE